MRLPILSLFLIAAGEGADGVGLLPGFDLSPRSLMPERRGSRPSPQQFAQGVIVIGNSKHQNLASGLIIC